MGHINDLDFLLELHDTAHDRSQAVHLQAMADSAATDLLDDLTANIDTLTTTLAPLLSQPITKTASDLQALERAKLYTLTTYAIESIILSYDKINVASNPSEAVAHPIMDELKRVQHYMQKIDAVEHPEKYAAAEKERELSLDKKAAGRIVKHGLVGNERYDKLRASREEFARAEAKRKLEALGEGGEKSSKKKKKAKRSEESVLDMPEEKLELVRPKQVMEAVAEESPKKEKSKKKKKKSKSVGEGA